MYIVIRHSEMFISRNSKTLKSGIRGQYEISLDLLCIKEYCLCRMADKTPVSDALAEEKSIILGGVICRI